MDKLHKNTLKCLAYLSAIIELSKGKKLTGYDVIVHLRTFGFEASPGTVYHQLGRLSQGGVIKGRKQGRRTVYEITEKGMEFFEEFKKNWSKPLTYVYQSLK